jgi:hypothetical protein
MEGEIHRMSWFSVRCIFHHAPGTYEERITIWRTSALPEAVRLAELDAASYETDLGCEYLGLAQGFGPVEGGIEPGREVFSLVRESPLDPTEYLSSFFDTGKEKQTPIE